MSKNIPKPIVRIGHIKDGSLSYEIDGNKVKNMNPTQFTNLIAELTNVRRKLVHMRDRNANYDVLTERQYKEVEELVKDGLSLKAVKLYKEYADVGLKDAKDFVDNLRQII